MRRLWFVAALVAGIAAGGPALACRIYHPLRLDDVKSADVVVVGRIAHYRIVRDKAFRRNLPRAERRRSVLTDYARFEVLVDEVVAGEAPRRLTVTWNNSTFGEPETLPAGPYLIALRRPEGQAATLFQAVCSSPFLFEVASDEARDVRRILEAQPR